MIGNQIPAPIAPFLKSDENNADKKAAQNMTSVQDSINALYAEAERNAEDGATMFALLHGMPINNAPAEIPIPMQPDASAMDIADNSPSQTMEATTAHKESPVAHANRSRAARFEALRMMAEREVDSAQLRDDAPLQHDIVSRTVTHVSMDSVALRDTTPLTHAAEGLPAALPKQPPAPPVLETDKDLDITDIHQLVQQAWEDGDAGIVGHEPDNQDQKSPADVVLNYNGQSTHGQTGEKQTGKDTDNPQSQVASDIGIAMENIAAAVKDQQPTTAAALDVDALKIEIVQAVKSEFQQALRDDLAPVVRNVVSEVMAEVSREQATQELIGKEQAANAGAKKATKSAAAKAAGTVQTKAPVKKATKSKSAKSTGTKTTTKSKTRVKKTRANLDIG